MSVECTKEAIFEMINQAMSQIGLKQKNNLVYYKCLSDDIIGVVNLGIQTVTGEKMSFHPTVGILSKDVESIMEEVTGMNTLDQLMPTISTPLIDLLPDKHLKEWELTRDKDNEAIMKDLFEQIVNHAFPFFEEKGTIGSIVQEVERGNYIKSSVQLYKLPLLYHCLGKTQKGVEYINEKLKENKKYSQKFLETFKTLL